MSRKLRVGILGATGLVGQRFVNLLENHPWFEVAVLAASPNSAGKTYFEAVKEKWKLDSPIPSAITDYVMKDASSIKEIAEQVDFVFCAVDMNKEEIKKLEEGYALAETPLISNNSASRWIPDVPVVVPELNHEHVKIIEKQRARLGVKNGFIACKPNCSIQCYVPAIHPLKEFNPTQILVSTYQALSGGGLKKLHDQDAIDNVNPLIKGEEQKSETEPLKIWGSLKGDGIESAVSPIITAQCTRVPVSDGHMASVFVNFEKKPSKDEIIQKWNSFRSLPQELDLPTAPKQFLHYMAEEDRPQTRFDRDKENGMAISVGRLREDRIFDYKFVALSHNALRGAAGGGVLIAELLKATGYINAK